MLFIILSLCAIIILIYLWLTKNHGYWNNRGVKYIEPKLFVGNMEGIVTSKTSMGQVYTDFYRKFKNEPYVGVYNMRKPTLLIRDINIIQDILVTQFNNFHDNLGTVDEIADPILAKNPFFLKGDRWKVVRNQITPLLTTAKVKAMLPLVKETCKNLVTYLEENEKEVNLQELSLKFTADNVASCAFGLEGKSFTNPNAEFKELAKQFFNVTFSGSRRSLLVQLFPELIYFLKVPIGVKEISIKLKEILMEAVRYRQEHNINRNDYLDSIIQLKSTSMPFDYNDDYMVAHAMTFFIDGAETSSIVLAYALYEIAANLDIQNKLKEEIDYILTKHDKKLSLEAIQEMVYLHAIFSETIRKYPVVNISRECTEDYHISINSGKSLKVEKGINIFIPVYAIHSDSQYYPNPDKFDPDRFLENSKHPAPKSCYFSFGDGPRMCLGRRFASMQIKAGLIAVVSHFEVRLNNKTKTPLDLDASAFILQTKSQIWLDFYTRKTNA